MDQSKLDELYMMRRKKNIKLKELAAHLGFTTSFVSRFETGKRKMKSESVEMYQNYIEEA